MASLYAVDLEREEQEVVIGEIKHVHAEFSSPRYKMQMLQNL